MTTLDHEVLEETEDQLDRCLQAAADAAAGWAGLANPAERTRHGGNRVPQAPPLGGFAMKNRMLIALLLAGVMIVPAVAQQSTSAQSGQPAAQSAGSADQAAPAAPSQDLSNSSQNFSVFSPRVIIRSNFVTHEQILFQYSRYFYGENAAIASFPYNGGTGGYPANAFGQAVGADKNAFTMAAIIWF